MKRSSWLLFIVAIASHAQDSVPLRERAERGDTAAQVEVGRQLISGTREEVTAARDWFRRAALAGDAEGAAWLGTLYLNRVQDGEAFADEPKDTALLGYRAEAERWLRASAEAGDSIGQMWLADLLGKTFDRAHQAESLRWYEASANQGVKRAMRAAASAYAEGRGTSRDPAAALAWYRRLAEDGDAEAAGRVGFAYDYGIGVARDRERAHSWYERAGFDTARRTALLDEVAAFALIRTSPGGRHPSAVFKRADGVERTVHVGDSFGTHLGKVDEIRAGSVVLIEVIEEAHGYFERPLEIVEATPK